MTTSSPISTLLGAGLYKPAKISDVVTGAKRDITMAALSLPTQTREFLDFKQRTSLQHVRDYVNSAVKGSYAGKLQAHITTIEGLYAMSALNKDGAPDPLFAMLASSHSPGALSKNNVMALL